MNPPDPRVIAKLHENLTAWLKREHPRAELLTVIGALSYEIGRICGQVTQHLSDEETDAMVEAVAEVMKDHVRAWRRGLRT